MRSTELSFEVSAQELVDPRTAATDAIEFEDLDTVLNPVLPSANEGTSATMGDEVEVEWELDAGAIDTLLTASGKIKA